MLKSLKTIKQSDPGKGSVCLYENGVMHQIYHDAIHLDFKDTQKEMKIYRKDFCQDGAKPILVDITNIRSI